MTKVFSFIVIIILVIVCFILIYLHIRKNKVIKKYLDHNDNLSEIVKELEIQREEIEKQREITIAQKDNIEKSYEILFEENIELKRKLKPIE